MKKLTFNCSLIALLFLFSTCARNPVTGKKQVVLMSEAQEIAMGKEADPQIVAQYGLYDDKALQAFITEKGKAMAAISHRPNLNYEFKIVDSDILNAFAVPGVMYILPAALWPILIMKQNLQVYSAMKLAI
jgi:predicted Zn-dependent protease